MGSTSATSTNASMSIVRVLRGWTVASSRSVRRTCLPLSSSYPRATSSQSTSTPSLEQKRRCSIGAPSFSCSCRKCRSRSRAALVRLTGTLTSPNDSDPFQSVRGISGPQARLQGGGEVGGLLLGLGLLGSQVLALGLALDQVEHSLAIGVLVVR